MQYYCIFSGFTLLSDNVGCHKSMGQIRIHTELNLHLADADFRWILHMSSVYYCVQVPFGEVSAVKNWLHISGMVNKPNPEHPRRPVCGFDCTRSEVLTPQFYVL